MNNPLLLIGLIGLLYVLMFGGLAFLRREGLSPQFVWEGVSITGLVLVVMAVGKVALHPLYFLILLYLLTMRVRLLAELGNQLARWDRLPEALTVYHLALRCWPDQLTQCLVLINVGATYLTCQQPERTIAVLEPVHAQLQKTVASQYLAGCGFNLGMAYRRVGRRAEALQQFRSVTERAPLSPYARLSERAHAATLQEAAASKVSHE